MLMINQLIGFGTGLSRPSILTLADQGNVADAETISLPAGSLVGDLAVLFDAPTNTSGSPTSVVPSGWTSLCENEFSTYRVIISYRVLTSADISLGSVTGMIGTGFSRKIIAIFRADAAIASVTSSTPVTEATSGNPVLQNIVASAGIAPLILFGLARGNGTLVTSGTLTTSGTALTSPTNTFEAFYEIQNVSGADRTYDMDDVGTVNILQSLFLAIA